MHSYSPLPAHSPLLRYIPLSNSDAAFDRCAQPSANFSDTVVTTPFESVPLKSLSERVPEIDPLTVPSMQVADLDHEDAHPDDELDHSPGVQDDLNQHSAMNSLKKES